MELTPDQIALIVQYILSLVPFLMIILLMIALMYYAHTSSKEKFNIFDTLLDPSTRKASIERIGMWLAMLSTTWWFFDKVAKDAAGWEEMVAYAGVLGLAKVATSLINAKYHPKAKEE